MFIMLTLLDSFEKNCILLEIICRVVIPASNTMSVFNELLLSKKTRFNNIG